MISIKKLFTKILVKIDTGFTFASANIDDVTVAAGSSSGALTIDISKSGYTPLALRGLRIARATNSGASAETCTAYSFRVDGNSCICAIYNNGSSAAKIKVTAEVLYIKTTAL